MNPLQMHLNTQARAARNLILDMIFKAKAAHIGCCLSCIDLLIGLYCGDILKVKPAQPDWQDRDRFILSKGHACVALYATLGLKGFFPLQRLQEYGTEGSVLGDHNTLHALPGIETTNGSLGHGLSLGIGMAWHLKNRGDSRVFVLVGDGECQEGSIWEGLMFAGFHKLQNLVLIIDNNNLETLGKTSTILDIEPLTKKIEAFGWEVKRIDGHSFDQIIEALKTRPIGKPLAIIAETIKGKGVSFMEHGCEWHGKYPNEDEYKRAKKELEPIELADGVMEL